MVSVGRAKELAKRDRVQAHWVKRKDGRLEKGKAAMVYSVAKGTAYLVQRLGPPEHRQWVCTCPYYERTGDRRCKHIQAVEDKVNRAEPS